ncbi:MAG TPA: metal ABC transporter ATP-binding protein [Anaeromyxobacteraceae bacterium]|nr:metal ABC transporter ATP-binding protein [Anaeromyxobacteraceae bacterium]
MANVLEVESLSVRFGSSEVLKRLHFAVPEGSALAIIGPNGAGKTVLLKALIGAVPYTGTVRWAKGARIGYIPQKLDIHRDLPLTGLDLLRAKAVVARASEAEISRALGLVQLEAAMVDQPVGTFSGGQFQRLLLAGALIGSPSVLLFDEPTAGIDEPGEGLLYEMIHRLQQEERLTLLLISHELSLVYRYATNVLCLSRTASPCFGPPREILTTGNLEQTYGMPVMYHRHDEHA